MVDQILRRLPIDLRDLMGPDEVKKATVRARSRLRRFDMLETGLGAKSGSMKPHARS